MVIWSLKVSNVGLHWSAGETNAALAALAALGVLSLPSLIPRSIVPKHELAAPMRWFWQAPAQDALEPALAKRIRQPRRMVPTTSKMRNE